MRKIALLIFLLALPAQAAALSLQEIVARIDYLHAEDAHRTSLVWDGYFKALNGNAYNVRQFYRSKDPQFNLTTAVKLHETRRLRLSLPLQMDNGYRAELYRALPYLGLGLVAQWAASEHVVLGLHLHDALQFGGDVSEQPCRDGFQRRFHCGTGLPWTDAQPYLQSSRVETFGQLNLHWRF